MWDLVQMELFPDFDQKSATIKLECCDSCSPCYACPSIKGCSYWWWWYLFWLQIKGFSYIWIYSGEYFQSARILIKHWGNIQNKQKGKLQKVKVRIYKIGVTGVHWATLNLLHANWSWRGRRDGPRSKNWSPSPTTPPTPRAPPAGLSASSPAPSSWSLLSGVPPPWSLTKRSKNSKILISILMLLLISISKWKWKKNWVKNGRTCSGT